MWLNGRIVFINYCRAYIRRDIRNIVSGSELYHFEGVNMQRLCRLIIKHVTLLAVCVQHKYAFVLQRAGRIAIQGIHHFIRNALGSQRL